MLVRKCRAEASEGRAAGPTDELTVQDAAEGRRGELFGVYGHYNVYRLYGRITVCAVWPYRGPGTMNVRCMVCMTAVWKINLRNAPRKAR
jgi:hypothetical protein